MSRSADVARPRRHARGVAALAVTTLVGFAVAPAAAADTPTVGIGVLRLSSYDRGAFWVPVWTDAPQQTITSVTAVLHSGVVAVSVPLVDQGNGGWAPAPALKLTDDGGPVPHLGDWTVEIVATDSADNQLDRADAGILDFTMVPLFGTADQQRGSQLAFDPVNLDRQHQHVTASGLLLGRRPGFGDGSNGIGPLPGRDVTVTRHYADNMPGRPADTDLVAGTDGSGAFGAGFDQVWSANYTATFAADDDTVHGSVTTWYAGGPGITGTPATLSAKLAKTLVEPGQNVIVSGTLLAGGAPLANEPVVLTLGANSQFPVTVSTDAQGRYTASIKAVPGWGGWTVQAIDPFVSAPMAQGDVSTPDDAVFGSVSVRLQATGYVTASARLYDPYEPNGAIYQQSVQLQYSKDGKTGWRTIARAVADYDTTSLKAPGYTNGYYRLYHPASTQLAHTSSAVYHLSRIPTRVLGNDATPEPVHSGKTLTVRGTLQEYRGGWRIMARKHVELWFLANGAKRWSYVSSGSTDAHGRAVLHGKATKTGKWIVQYWGDAAHFNSVATADPVTVR